jgi:hypothetical protein
MRRNLSVLFAVAVLFAAAPMFGEVIFNESSGVGFVGKGDVQQLFIWNNKTLQDRAGDVEFYYQELATFDVPCKKELEKKVMRNTYARAAAINSAVTADPRQKNQFTGFNLNGYDGDSVSVFDTNCPGGWEADGDPVEVGSDDDGAALWVRYGTESHKLTLPE